MKTIITHGTQSVTVEFIGRRIIITVPKAHLATIEAGATNPNFTLVSDHQPKPVPKVEDTQSGHEVIAKHLGKDKADKVQASLIKNALDADKARAKSERQALLAARAARKAAKGVQLFPPAA